MKFFLFCLLVCCVFENAFADELVNQLDEVYNNSMKSVNQTIPNQILSEVSKNVDNASDDDRKKAQNCFEYAKSSMKTFLETMVKPAVKELGKCRTAGLGSRDVEGAKNCSNKVIDVFLKLVAEVQSTAQSCISSIKD